MERGRRLRGPVLFPTSGRPLDSEDRVVHRPRSRLARETRTRPGIHGGRKWGSRIHLPDNRNLLGLRSRSLCLFYSLSHALILGRVTSGEGGAIILEEAKKVLREEFPDLNDQITFHQPDEKNKRHGQAIAAASLPAIN